LLTNLFFVANCHDTRMLLQRVLSRGRGFWARLGKILSCSIEGMR
jgi:hypothetical protein